MSEQMIRQVKVFEYYLKGRINQLASKARRCPAESATYDMAIAELQIVYDQILPELQKALKDTP